MDFFHGPFSGPIGVAHVPATWRRLLGPWLQRVWDVYKQAGLPGSTRLSSGNVISLIPDMILWGSTRENPSTGDGLHRLKPGIRPRPQFLGRHRHPADPAHGTPDEVRRHTTEVIETLCGRRRAVDRPVPGGHVRRAGKNIVALVETVVRAVENVGGRSLRPAGQLAEGPFQVPLGPADVLACRSPGTPARS